MPGLAVGDADLEDGGPDADFKPYTFEQARAWRGRQSQLSVWRVLGLQLLVGLMLSGLLGLSGGRLVLTLSAAWGALSVLVPAVVFARALVRQGRQVQAGAALAGLFGWELVKIVLTVAMLLAAPRVIDGLSWLALVAGFVVTMKVSWLALGLQWVHNRQKA